jgi:hypothetical protein
LLLLPLLAFLLGSLILLSCRTTVVPLVAGAAAGFGVIVCIAVLVAVLALPVTPCSRFFFFTPLA